MDLVANNLSYKPDDQYHLNEVSFNFKEGNLYTILGRTLSGKTTLLKTIAGLLTPDSGEIEFDGKNFLKIPVWERNVAMVYQQFINYPHLNVFENIAFPLKQRKINQSIIKEKVMDALKSVAGMFCIIFGWIDFFFAFILTFTEVQLLPVKIVALNSSVTPWWSLSASALVSVAPLIIVAFIVERYLSKGNLSGAIK